MSKLISAVGDTHSCPMVTGTTPHVGGTIITGSENVHLHDKPIARMGDKVLCTGCGMQATIVQGCPNVLINNKPVAFVGCMTSHGGVITSGSMSVQLSGAMVKIDPVTGIEFTNIATMPIELIDFPSASYKAKFLARRQLQIAEAEQNKLKNKGYLLDAEFSV